MAENDTFTIPDLTTPAIRLNQSVIHRIREQRKNFQILSDEAELGLIIAYSVFIFSGIVTNTVLLCSILREPKLRTPQNMFITSLAVSDILLCGFCMPFTLYMVLNDDWAFGNILCKLVPFVQGTATTMSISTCIAIAINRYRIILSYHNKTQTIPMYLSIFFMNIASAIPIIPIILVQKLEGVGEKRYGVVLFERCVEKWPSVALNRVYTGLMILLHYVVPVLTIAVCYFKIVNFLHLQMMRSQEIKNIKTQQKRNRQTSKILSVITGTFLLCFFPYHLIRFLYDYTQVFLGKTRLVYLLFGVSHIVAMSTTTWNPLLYGLLNRNLRAGIINFMKSFGSGFRRTYNLQHNQIGARGNGGTVHHLCEMPTTVDFRHKV